MKFIAKFLIVAAGGAISIQAQSANCKEATSEVLDRSFAALKGSGPNFLDLTKDGQVIGTAKLGEVHTESLVKCIDQCVEYWPPAEPSETPLEEQYEQQYCRGVKWTDVGSRCSLYRVGPADIKLFNGPEDVPIVGGAVLGGCSTPYAQRLIATDEEHTPSCCDVWYRSTGVEALND